MPRDQSGTQREGDSGGIRDKSPVLVCDVAPSLLFPHDRSYFFRPMGNPDGVRGSWGDPEGVVRQRSGRSVCLAYRCQGPGGRPHPYSRGSPDACQQRCLRTRCIQIWGHSSSLPLRMRRGALVRHGSVTVCFGRNSSHQRIRALSVVARLPIVLGGASSEKCCLDEARACIVRGGAERTELRRIAGAHREMWARSADCSSHLRSLGLVSSIKSHPPQFSA